jgi:hypothetical protein
MASYRVPDDTSKCNIMCDDIRTLKENPLHILLSSLQNLEGGIPTRDISLINL